MGGAKAAQGGDSLAKQRKDESHVHKLVASIQFFEYFFNFKLNKFHDVAMSRKNITRNIVFLVHRLSLVIMPRLFGVFVLVIHEKM